MKKVIAVVLSVLAFLVLPSCGENKDAEQAPQIGEMRNICELATMECYYHNVAKFTQEDADGFLWMKKDKRFWVEYSGIVKIGIDASQVDIKVEGDNVTITIPPAKVLSCTVDHNSLNENSFIIDGESAKITAEDQTVAFQQAQDKMMESASQNSILLVNGQQRAKQLLENYIYNIGENSGRQYKIEWVYVENTEQENSAVPESESEEPAENA